MHDIRWWKLWWLDACNPCKHSKQQHNGWTTNWKPSMARANRWRTWSHNNFRACYLPSCFLPSSVTLQWRCCEVLVYKKRVPGCGLLRTCGFWFVPAKCFWSVWSGIERKKWIDFKVSAQYRKCNARDFCTAWAKQSFGKPFMYLHPLMECWVIQTTPRGKIRVLGCKSPSCQCELPCPIHVGSCSVREAQDFQNKRQNWAFPSASNAGKVNCLVTKHQPKFCQRLLTKTY